MKRDNLKRLVFAGLAFNAILLGVTNVPAFADEVAFHCSVKSNNYGADLYEYDIEINDSKIILNGHIVKGVEDISIGKIYTSYRIGQFLAKYGAYHSEFILDRRSGSFKDITTFENHTTTQRQESGICVEIK